MVYKCIKCNYESDKFRNMKKHMNIKKNCIKNFNIIDCSDNEVIVCSLISDYKNKNLDMNKIKNYKFTYKYKDLLYEKIDNIEKNKLKICNYCNLDCKNMYLLREHIIYECFENQMINQYENIREKEQHINNINNINNIIDNNGIVKINSDNTNITNNYILNINNPIPFDNNWDISEINEASKANIILSKYMYTILLKEILNNENNLNVIIDKNKNIGIVYKNDIDRYIRMEIKEIAGETMNKLKDSLLKITDELKNKEIYDESILDYKNKDIKNKHACYINNPETNKNVIHHLTCMYDDVKIISKKKMDENLSKIIIDNDKKLKKFSY